MRHRAVIAAAVTLALGFGAFGCGQGAGSPTAAVTEAFRLVDQGDLEGLVNLTCVAQKETIRQQFEFSDVSAMLPGADLGQLFQAINVDTSAMTVTELSSSGDAATIQLGGSLNFSFDAEQLRDLFRQLAEQQGQQVDDATLDSMVAALQASSQSMPMTETVEIVREDGSWKLCSRLTLMP